MNLVCILEESKSRAEVKCSPVFFSYKPCLLMCKSALYDGDEFSSLHLAAEERQKIS